MGKGLGGGVLSARKDGTSGGFNLWPAHYSTFHPPLTNARTNPCFKLTLDRARVGREEGGSRVPRWRQLAQDGMLKIKYVIHPTDPCSCLSPPHSPLTTLSSKGKQTSEGWPRPPSAQQHGRPSHSSSSR